MRGRLRLGAAVDRLLCSSGYSRWVEAVDCSDGVRMILDTDEIQQKSLYWTGSYDRRAVEVLTRYLPDQGIFIDVGAGVGSICLFVAGKCREMDKKIDVYAFEPLRLNHDRLVRNAILNDLTDRVHCQRLALGAEKGCLTLCFHGEVGAAAVVRSGSAIHELAGPQTERVLCDTLDSWIAEQDLIRLDVLKVDIEGAEPLMFRGAMNSIERFRPIILGEFNHWWAARHGLSLTADCFNPLWELGYRPFRLSSRRGPWEEIHGHPAPGPDMEDTLWIYPAQAASKGL